MTRRRPESVNVHRLTQNDTKKNIKLENARPWWNKWFLVQEIHLHSRQTSTRNAQMLTRSTRWLYDERKDYIDPKGPKQRNCSKQIQTHNLRTNDVENTNSTNKRKDILHEEKGCFEGTRGTAELLYMNQHILNESKTWRKNLAMAWIDFIRYDMVSQSLIIKYLKMYKISHEVINLSKEPWTPGE